MMEWTELKAGWYGQRPRRSCESFKSFTAQLARKLWVGDRRNARSTTWRTERKKSKEDKIIRSRVTVQLRRAQVQSQNSMTPRDEAGCGCDSQREGASAGSRLGHMDTNKAVEKGTTGQTFSSLSTYSLTGTNYQLNLPIPIRSVVFFKVPDFWNVYLIEVFRRIATSTDMALANSWNPTFNVQHDSSPCMRFTLYRPYLPSVKDCLNIYQRNFDFLAVGLAWDHSRAWCNS